MMLAGVREGLCTWNGVPPQYVTFAGKVSADIIAKGFVIKSRVLGMLVLEGGVL
jgi:hypothetical protein